MLVVIKRSQPRVGRVAMKFGMKRWLVCLVDVINRRMNMRECSYGVMPSAMIPNMRQYGTWWTILFSGLMGKWLKIPSPLVTSHQATFNCGSQVLSKTNLTMLLINAETSRHHRHTASKGNGIAAQKSINELISCYERTSDNGWTDFDKSDSWNSVLVPIWRMGNADKQENQWIIPPAPLHQVHC